MFHTASHVSIVENPNLHNNPPEFIPKRSPANELQNVKSSRGQEYLGATNKDNTTSAQRNIYSQHPTVLVAPTPQHAPVSETRISQPIVGSVPANVKSGRDGPSAFRAGWNNDIKWGEDRQRMEEQQIVSGRNSTRIRSGSSSTTVSACSNSRNGTPSQETGKHFKLD